MDLKEQVASTAQAEEAEKQGAGHPKGSRELEEKQKKHDLEIERRLNRSARLSRSACARKRALFRA
jgi:hypothetical protein